jgi:hypothetical protein
MQATTAVKLEVLKLSGADDPCSALKSEQAPSQQETQALTQSVDFPFESGAVTVGELENGRYAFVASASNGSGERFLTGCTAREIAASGEAQVIRIELEEFRGSCGSSSQTTCYDGPPGTEGVGACVAGSATCSDGLFTVCTGQVLPAEETCTGSDDDCNGAVDDVDPDELQDDPQNCGVCGRVCQETCAAGECDQVVDSGPPSVDAGNDGPHQEAGLDGSSQEAGLDGPMQEAGLDGPLQEAGLDGPLQEAGPDGPSPDSQPTPDLLQPDLEPPCTAGTFECLSDGTARHCEAGVWKLLGTCPLGCSNTQKACRVPSNVGADLVAMGTGDLDLSQLAAPFTIDTDTGEIGGASGTIRPAGTGLDPGSGIYFTTLTQPTGFPGLGVFSIKNMVVPQGTTVEVIGQRALVLLASGGITLNGVVDAVAAGSVGGPGGFGGGPPDTQGFGPGAGLPSQASTFGDYCSGGGGGAGFGGTGGAGGTSNCASPNNFAGGAGGGVYGTPSLVPLIGGSGGAGGSTPAGSTVSVIGYGGGGGGAVQLVSATFVAVGASGGVNAGAGGGAGAISGGGAGGGAGGAILIEAPAVTVASGGVLAANGGGGGGGDCT